MSNRPHQGTARLLSVKGKLIEHGYFIEKNATSSINSTRVYKSEQELKDLIEEWKQTFSNWETLIIQIKPSTS